MPVGVELGLLAELVLHQIYTLCGTAVTFPTGMLRNVGREDELRQILSVRKKREIGSGAGLFEPLIS